MQFVLDCSVAISWCLVDENNPTANAILAIMPDAEAFVPGIWSLEIANVLLVAERRNLFFPARGSDYDLVYMDIIWVSRFAQKNWLMDLSKKISKEELSKFLPKDVDGGHYNKRLYRIPFHSDVGVLYYRKDLLNSGKIDHPPETFKELKYFSKKLQKPQGKGKPRWGYVWQGQQYEGLVAMFVEILYSSGGSWINEETLEVELDKPEILPKTLEAIKFLHNTIKDNISPPNVTTSQEEETRRLFQEGDAVFLRNWPYVWNEANKADSDIQGKFAIAPVVHAENQKSIACQGGWGLGISKFTKHPDEAWKAVEFFTSAATQKKYALRTGNMPTRRSLFYDPQLVERYSYYPTLLKILDNRHNTVLRPAIPDYHEASAILQKHLNSVLTKLKITPEEIEKEIKAAAFETRQLLSPGKVTKAGAGSDRSYEAVHYPNTASTARE
jgi:multiple sugar transport system substrate-binding protein